MNPRDLKKLSLTELLAVYNTHATKGIERFADRKSALRRTQVLLDSLSTQPQIDAPAPPELAAAGRKTAASVLVAHANSPHGRVEEYSSVLKAFKVLNLPIGRHQAFRRKLKLAGNATIDNFVFTATFKEEK